MTRRPSTPSRSAPTPPAPATPVRPSAGAVHVDRAGEVLSLVRAGKARTMTELAGSMGVARSTVTQRVERLLHHGLLRTTGELAGQRGRPPMLLEFNPGAARILVAHVGMSGSRVAVTDLAGTVLADAMVATPVTVGPRALIEQLQEAGRELLHTADSGPVPLGGVGVGLPSPIELATSRTHEDGRPRGWDSYPIAQRLTAGFGAPTFIDHDVNVLALGEQRAGWPDAGVFLCLKIGTVIGCGVVVNGVPVRGAQALSGEIGHTRVPGNDTPCLCGNTGCLDAVASGGALAAALSEQGLPTPHCRDVARLARNGVLPAVQAVRAAGRAIGEVLAAAVNLLNPDAIAVWGYLVEAEDPLFAGMRESIYEHSLPGATRTLRLERARLGDNAGVRGTAMMVAEHILAPEAVDRHLAANVPAGRDGAAR